MAKQLAKDKTGLVEMMREKGLRARVCQNGDMIIEPFALDMEAAIGPTIAWRQQLAQLLAIPIWER